MFLPTIYITFLVSAFSWTSFLPTTIQMPNFSWSSFEQPKIISPQPPQMSFPTWSPTSTPTPTTKQKATPTPTKKPTPAPTRIVFQTVKSTVKPITVVTIKPTATPTPKLTIQPTLKPTTKTTVTLTPKLTATPTVKPTTAPATTSVSLDSNQQYILDQINEYRASQGLSSVKPDKYSCGFAKIRSQEIVNNFNHDGFQNRANAKNLPYPSYHAVTENIAMTSDYKQVVTMWKNSAGHAANMRADTPYVCVAYTRNYYAYEGWKP